MSVFDFYKKLNLGNEQENFSRVHQKPKDADNAFLVSAEHAEESTIKEFFESIDAFDDSYDSYFDDGKVYGHAYVWVSGNEDAVKNDVNNKASLLNIAVSFDEIDSYMAYVFGL